MDAFVFEHLTPRVRKLAHVVERSDAMLAVYPGQGTRFQRHIDNTASDGRVLTVLVYLNAHWRQDDGGALRVFPANGRTPGATASAPEGARGGVDVMPECGRMAMFFADEVPHEVRPTRAARHAMTVWYYDKQLRTQAVAAAASGAGASLAGGLGANAGARQEAAHFLHSVLALAALFRSRLSHAVYVAPQRRMSVVVVLALSGAGYCHTQPRV